MVLYHTDGRVIKAHDDYLEQKARQEAENFWYTDQIDIVKLKDSEAREKVDERVTIVVDKQSYAELYYSGLDPMLRGRELSLCKERDSAPLPKQGLDRRTLMKCCSLADEFFTFNPNAATLHLPISYPRKHNNEGSFKERSPPLENHVSTEDKAARKQHLPQVDNQMAYIRDDEIKTYLVPWIMKMEKVVNKLPTKTPMNKLPRIQTPNDLLNKIHLYNVMLQLGIPSFFQQPLIDALVLQMYQTNLNQCHLDTLEMTVCRFHSRSVAVLDPVINHLIGTYSLRPLADRQQAKAPQALQVLSNSPVKEDSLKDKDKYLPNGTQRKWLEFSELNADRKDYPEDTISIPPRLEVLGHSIKHWSGVRRNGSTAAAHTGFPLNVGRVFKYYRRQPTNSICVEKNDQQVNHVEDSSHRLVRALENPPDATLARSDDAEKST
jgi:hypothetical protein